MATRSATTRRRLALAATSLLASIIVGACGASGVPASPAATAAGAPAGETGANDKGGAAEGSGGGGAAVAPVPPVADPGTVTVDPVAGGGTSGSTGSGTASTGSAVAYPYYGGTPGVAPDHTIVVSGYGQASMAADGADRAKAQAAAIAAALADARTQADAIAKATGVTITGVLSVNAAGYGGYPIPMAGSAGTGSVEAPPAVTPSDPGLAPEPVPSAGPIDFGISVTVAYSIGG